MVAKDVHHAPELAVNLLSVSRIASHGKSLIFDIDGCPIVDIPTRVPQSHVLGAASQHQGLYRLDHPVQFGLLAGQPHDLWHRRMVTGIPKNSVSNIDCITYVKGKQCRLPFPKPQGKRATNLLDVVHSDICGPMQVRSSSGARYFISLIDDFSRKSFVYFLKNKTEALQKFKEFVAFIERKTSRKVKCLRTDNGQEYVNEHFAQFLTANGIRHERSIPDTPEQNGIAERLNLTLVEKARTMLIDASLSTDLWAEAIGTANYLRNRCLTKALRNVTPEEAWSGRKPNLSHLKLFGCLAMVHIPARRRQKWDAKSKECIFVGYSETSKGYRTINRFTEKLNIARVVVFLESSFPGTRQSNAHLDEPEKCAPDDGEQVIMWKLQDDNPSETEADKAVSSPIEGKESSCCDTVNEDARTNEGRPKRNRVPNRTIFNSDFVVYQAGMYEGDPVSYADAIRRPDAHDWLAAKWDAKSEECIFVGYSETSKGYRTINRFTKKLNIARDVVFLESSFPGTRQTNAHLDEPEKSAPDDGEEVIMWKLQDDKPSETEADKAVSSPIEGKESSCCDTVNEDARTNEGRPKRNRVPNRTIFNSDFVVYQAGMYEGDPVSYADAIRRPDAHDWLAAVDQELASHHKNHSWEMCSLPVGKKATKTKYKIDATIERWKARLLAKGCSQKPGIDYEDTFAPTLGHASLRLLLSLAVQNDLEIIQMDVVTAFLNPKLKEEIHMELPEGVTKCQYPTYCRLMKSIYAFKQSSRAWYDMLDGTLQKFGMKRLKSEPCVYYRRIVEKMLIVGVYVDDSLILSNDQQATTDLKEALHKQFEMKDLGKAHWCLGIRINQDKKVGTLSIDQARYIDQILETFGMVDCKVAKTPLDLNLLLSKEMSPKTEEERTEMKNVPYREAVGSLLYLSQANRADKCHAVGVVSRYSNNPGKAHWIAVKRIMRYLKGTRNMKLVYKRAERSLTAYCDADWANDKDDRRSTTGFFVCLSGTAVSWSSKKQRTVALSTAEAEYMAPSHAMQEITWLQSLCTEMSIYTEKCRLLCDNSAATSISQGQERSSRTKHTDIRHHFVRENVQAGDVLIEHVATENNAADMLTKVVTAARLNECTSLVGMTP
ncbi:hypothetical protein M513_12352 [Trichuris suis]|uniref:Integrase catalytic domain-containing protein n=1 Tax=Trichuris suis TaxID=68888 RepID=A0A085LP75_9BILA|nr:hypothetical protein M513_12352 [Trichuris suis]